MTLLPKTFIYSNQHLCVNLEILRRRVMRFASSLQLKHNALSEPYLGAWKTSMMELFDASN